MRVPWPIVMLLLLAVVAGAWIVGTREVDFLREPDGARLEAARKDGAVGVERAEMPLPAFAVLNTEVDKRGPQRIQTRRPPPGKEENHNPPLDKFVELGNRGARHLIDLGRLAERGGDRQLALLAWERVIDTCRRRETTHLVAAFEAVKRLRQEIPVWSARNRSLPVVLQMSGPESREEKLAGVLEKLEQDLAKVSHGVLDPDIKLTVIKPAPPPPAPKSKSKSRVKRKVRVPPPPPVTLWLSGAGDDPRVTSKVTLTVSSTTTEAALYDEALRQLLKLVTTTLNKDKDRRMIDTPEKKESVLDALSRRITRLRWHELASDLNAPPEPSPPDKPSRP